MKKIGAIALLLWISFALSIVLPLVYIKLPADVEYNKKFGSHVTMAIDQASFEGIKEQILILWKNMNDTFGTENLENIYNSPWFWDQTYDNSLKAQEDYFRRLVNRIDDQIKEQQAIINGNRTIIVPYNQWYQQSLDSLRTELNRAGGLDWALKGAWYLKCAPAAYWLMYWDFPIAAILFILALYTTFIWTCNDDY